MKQHSSFTLQKTREYIRTEQVLTLQKTHENICTEQLLTFTKKTRENIRID